MKIAVTGSTGLVGSALVRLLSKQGHDVVEMTRPAQWDPEKGRVDAAAVAGIDALVHLAGENIAAGRWTGAQKARIRDRRVRGTKLIVDSLAGARKPPQVLGQRA